MCSKVPVVQRRSLHMVAPSGCVNKSPASGIDADMGNITAFGGSEKDQVSFFKPVSTHRNPFSPLSLRRSGKIQTVQFVYGIHRPTGRGHR